MVHAVLGDVRQPRADFAEARVPVSVKARRDRAALPEGAGEVGPAWREVGAPGAEPAAAHHLRLGLQ